MDDIRQRKVCGSGRVHLGMYVLVKSSWEYFCMDASKTGIIYFMNVISRICLDGCGTKGLQSALKNIVNQG